MEKELENLEAIVARSNLVATAGEFVPKSQVRQERYGEVYVPGASRLDAVERFNNSFPRFDQQDASCNDFDMSLDQPHSSNYNYRNDSHKGNNEFYSRNREPKYSKPKNDDRWKRVDKEFVKSNLGLKNRASEKVSVVNPGRAEYDNGDGSGQENSYYSGRPKQKQRTFDRPNYRGYERNTTYYRSNHWNNNTVGPDDYQPYHSGARSKNRQYEDNYADNDDSSGRKRNNVYKNGSKLKHQTNKFDYVNKSRSEDSINGEKEKTNKNSQREHLIDLLTRGMLECLVCCEHVHQTHPTWSCNNCYHVLHLKCIIKWAKSSKSDFGWRCPACQNVTSSVPFDYLCFCSKVRDPEWNRNDCPHSCGEVCGKTRRESCPHKCVLLCHPGPCPQCTATVTKYCGCKKTSRSVQCFTSELVVCEGICGKFLNCKVHECAQKCHTEACAGCTEVIQQVCFCEKDSREVTCSLETVNIKKFSCGSVCGQQLSCGNHFCNLVCHEGECPKCELMPELVKHCPCGKNEIKELAAEERTSCKDAIPTCEEICGKQLICGQPGSPHTCQSKCHEGQCDVCPLETTVKCRCGHMDKMLPCLELNVRADDARCDKRCSKKRSCGKHKCNQLCCIDIDHDCPLPCNRLLPCGLHRCEQTCHRGHCEHCWRASFEELYCECGSAVIFPPVPCGTRRPPCSKPCTRNHSCEHPPTHNCHSDVQCPPCTVLTKKYCYGRHELRKAVPCHQETFSCGLPCNKELECGRHKCILACHSGPCLKEGQPCVQPCTVARPVCGHFCGAPCHEGPCPADLPCKEMVRVTCECGHRFTTRACHDNAKEFHRIATVQLASKMADLQAGQSIDLNDMASASKKLSYKTLECNDECRLIERNRRLAIALQIRNPDLSAKLTPRYSDFMRQWAKKDARFCQMVHDKLTDLVQLAKQSKQKSRSYSFDSMNREKRHFVHEYCEHFGCESVAYDQEPKRNVVATALKDKSWLPSMSLLEVIQRESGPRKVPIPVNTKLISTSQRTMDVLPVKVLPAHQQDGEVSTNQSEPQIDYFDWHS